MEPQFIGDRRKRRDRRDAPRQAEHGDVEISFDIPVPMKIQANLIETSATGFRAAHDSKAIEPGLAVRYKRVGASGEARVIWTQVLEGRRVSGFLEVLANGSSIPPIRARTDV
jgi:hypothetical protein